ncbi:ATP-binding protein [Hymenobacter arizonensis]|uniref:histidine kinase n=1 Tax=Hymenobacter arizonensis TaxID=1227077 RepID=A0A1I5ZAW6_HYMAR|nr:ATP-binding protein [Hymenobacter arizonensis]SFQ53631.1 Bacteriophytochrome (light-regulated signal transduction histidine kinase) [Hymenobacter arizonensis]
MSLTDDSLLLTAVDLTNCDREPIHIPGLVQPYGFLLCLDPKTRRVVQASENIGDFVGIAAEELLGAGIAQLLGAERAAEVDQVLGTLTETAKLLGTRLDEVPGQPFYKLIMHRYDQLLWLEFEPVTDAAAPALDLPFLNEAMSQMLAATGVREFCQYAVEQVRAITGFDRVAIYRFAEDESGEIVAEAKHPDLDTWLGLHYPASDIPKQARAMYLKNWLRFIPDAHYTPARLVPVNNPATARPPDMTYSVLRSVSPIHLQYLHNMGSAATMTISLIKDGQLWGMITCHHRTPRLVSYELRDLCQFIGKTFSALLGTKEQHDEQGYQLRIRENQVRLFEHLSTNENFVEGLHQYSPTVMDVFDCGGAAVCFDDEIIMLGTTPSREEIVQVLAWLQEHAPDDVFHTNSYAQLDPAGLNLRPSASGILAISLAEAPGNYILWFRPEVIQTVTWAGQNSKHEVLADGQIFLSPRQSFEAWKQLVENTAVAWKPMELEAAKEIRLHISDLRLKVFNELQARAASLSRLNTELERSNEELDSFAYVASHDLKEPLRGIHNYSIFLLEDYADQLDAEGVSKLQTLVRLSQRMEGLIESLLQLSRVGRQELALETFDMNLVLAEVLDLLAPRFEQTGTTVTVDGPLPVVHGDPVRIREVFNNLLTNALRYNDNPQKRVEVGAVSADQIELLAGKIPSESHVFYVRDNGIGIDPKHHDTIFRIFKRLHGQEKYGGGSGAGLAIAKKMVEKHGGALWVESARGEGATFYFSLPL